ncbi:MAG TPA: hypothetical protein VIL04_10500 [Solirubrobacterales bacterium]
MRAAGADPGEIEAVLIVTTTGRAPAPRRRLRKPRPVPAEPSAPLTTLTVVDAEPLTGDPEAWLAILRGDEEARSAYVERALAVVRRALGAARVAAGDPSLGELPAAPTTRIGYATGEQLVAGSWGDALALPRDARKRSRTDALRPGERFAALLGGREEPLACEELVLRAAADLEAGRWATAAVQARAAVEALLAARGELGDGQERDLERLEAARGELERSATEALGNPSPAPSEAVREAVRAARRVLARRAADRS